MLAAAVLAVFCALGPTQDPGDRARAEQLSRGGDSAAALQQWERIAAANPSDVEARLWIGRLQLRLGRTGAAEATFRAVLAQHPRDIDARVGLGNALGRRGELHEALAVLYEAERDATGNGELLAAIARAYRNGGNDRYALYYYTRAAANAPDDPDIRAEYENSVRSYGEFVAFEGFSQRVSPDADAASGRMVLRLRATPKMHLLGQVRVQHGDGYADRLYGGGLEWRAGATTTVWARAAGRGANLSLPRLDAAGGGVHYAGVFEIGGEVRELSFQGAGITTASPTLAWDPGGRWRLDTRYTLAYSRFDASGETSVDHSAMLRGTWRAWRRVSLNGTYAYGIESFEDLTADRLGALGAHTAAAGTRITLRSLTAIDATWEHQWRSNASRLNRVTITLSQFFP